jgi:hypothetical protein
MAAAIIMAAAPSKAQRGFTIQNNPDPRAQLTTILNPALTKESTRRQSDL